MIFENIKISQITFRKNPNENVTTVFSKIVVVKQIFVWLKSKMCRPNQVSVYVQYVLITAAGGGNNLKLPLTRFYYQFRSANRIMFPAAHSIQCMGRQRYKNTSDSYS